MKNWKPGFFIEREIVSCWKSSARTEESVDESMREEVHEFYGLTKYFYANAWDDFPHWLLYQGYNFLL